MATLSHCHLGTGLSQHCTVSPKRTGLWLCWSAPPSTRPGTSRFWANVCWINKCPSQHQPLRRWSCWDVCAQPPSKADGHSVPHNMSPSDRQVERVRHAPKCCWAPIPKILADFVSSRRAFKAKGAACAKAQRQENSGGALGTKWTVCYAWIPIDGHRQERQLKT